MTLFNTRDLNPFVLCTESCWYYTCTSRLLITNLHILLVQKDTLHNQDAKWWKPCSSVKILKTTPCSAAHTHLGQIRKCSPSPPRQVFKLQFFKIYKMYKPPKASKISLFSKYMTEWAILGLKTEDVDETVNHLLESASVWVGREHDSPMYPLLHSQWPWVC